MITRYETHEPKKKRSDAQSTSAATDSPVRAERPMYECSRAARQLLSRKRSERWLSANTKTSSSVPIAQPHRENANGSASSPGPVVPLSRFSAVPTSAKSVVSGFSYLMDDKRCCASSRALELACRALACAP
jgi:hypothetical protein